METAVSKIPEEICVRPARGADLPWLVSAFPWSLKTPSQSRFLIAENAKRSLLAGCCFLSQQTKKKELAATIELQAVSENALRLAGPALLEVLRRRAWAENWKVLFHRAVIEGSALERLLVAEQFEQSGFVTAYEMDLETFWEDFDGTYQRLLARNKISRQARILPLREAPATAVAELIRRTIGGDAAKMEMQFGSQEFSPELSQVIQIGPAVVAALLIQMENGIPEIGYLAIDSKQRNSWIYVFLLREFARKLREQGCNVFRYKTNPGNHRAPANTGTRLGGKILGRQINYRLDLIVESEPDGTFSQS